MFEVFIDGNGDLNAAAGFVIGGTLSLIGVGASLVSTYLLGRWQTKAGQVQKVAEFRQAWINDLRSDMVEIGLFGDASRHSLEERQIEAFQRLNLAVQLRMNPKDPDFDELCMAIRQLRANPSAASDRAYSTICQRILKREWDRLKNDLEENRI